ncbi:Glutamate receptor ionotropic, kainate 3 [Nymphon striatum]|nr:Glutamate receptor ionotropic, kainate 3 [Nymphon striatum]
MSTIQANLARNKILNSLNENQLNTYFLAKNFTANSELTQNEIIRVIQCIMEGAMHNYRYKSILLLLQVIPIWCYYMILHIQRMENITIIKLFYSLDNTSSADLAMGDLTITYEREQAVDFTMPFMNLGIGILFSKPSESVPSLFSFLSPLSWDRSTSLCDLRLILLWRVTYVRGTQTVLFIFTRNTYVRRGKSVTDHLASLLAILTRLDSCVTSLLKCKFLKFETVFLVIIG